MALSLRAAATSSSLILNTPLRKTKSSTASWLNFFSRSKYHKYLKQQAGIDNSTQWTLWSNDSVTLSPGCVKESSNALGYASQWSQQPSVTSYHVIVAYQHLTMTHVPEQDSSPIGFGNSMDFQLPNASRRAHGQKVFRVELFKSTTTWLSATYHIMGHKMALAMSLEPCESRSP